MKLDFGKILTRSWQIIWKHKVLWVFGILAGFAEGNGGGNSGGNNSNSGPNGSAPSFNEGNVQEMSRGVGEFFQEYMLIIIGVCIAIFLLSLAFYALGMMGRIGMIIGTYKVEKGADVLAFGELWSESLPYFWRFFGLNFLIGLAFFLLIVPFGLLAIFTMGAALLCLIPLVCILVPVSWVVSVIVEQAQAAIVSENLGTVEGFRRGWEIAKSDVGGMIVLSLILGVGSLFIGFVLALPVIIALLPLIFSAAQLTNIESIPPTVWVSLACCTLYFPILLLLNGILTAYKKTAWALSYLQLVKPGENAPIALPADA